MTEQRGMLVETAHSVFAEAETKGFAPIIEAGFPSLLIAEERGGFGGDWGDLFAVLHVAGGRALTLPVGETIIAAKLLSDAGSVVRDGPLTLEDIELGAFIRSSKASRHLR
jgi:acyl-CoA dehydrogenase